MREFNKKNLLLIAASTALIGGSFVFAEYKNGLKKSVIYINSEVSPGGAFASNLSTTDTDSDGLKDWEEELWGLNPNQEDSNSNGILDGEEVTQVIKKNEQNLAKNSSVTKTAKTPTKTEEFGKKFFTNYLELRKSGDLTEESILDLTARMAESITTTGTGTTLYSSKNIVTTSGLTTEDYRRYANSFGAIRERYKNAYQNNPLQVTEEGVNLEDPNLLKRLAQFSSQYKKMAAELARIPVPQPLAATHIALLNTYSESATGLYEISTIATDPIIAIKGIARHEGATQNEYRLVKDIYIFLQEKDMTFTLGEGGKFFETYTQQ